MGNKLIGVKLEGVIYAHNGDIPLSCFLDSFMRFVEENGWYFGGGALQVDEDGNQIDEIDNTIINE
ncbi:hypothetical protein EBB07_14575 [Paenibacillaceae bacterium]|nr:hypothetical protein EBB07_14575 [Paenibacillaceae bacterium]